MCHWVRVKLWFFVDMSFNSWYILMSFNSWYTTIQFVVEIRGSWNWTTNWMTSWNWTTNWMTYVPRIEWHIRGTFFFLVDMWFNACYGVATISRILKNICLFAEYRSLLGSFAKETYIFKHPTNRSHPIPSFWWSMCDSVRVTLLFFFGVDT